mmetsp:Transcript_8357/g.18284  ORF Transcript_8357/g.18284 Transcript_8357/m.18284 type:complete len:286 (+) Transcript_8357:104-961(+)
MQQRPKAQPKQYLPWNDSKCVPVWYVVSIVAVLYLTTLYHVLLAVDPATGVYHLVGDLSFGFHCVAGVMLYCFATTILTPPGGIPRDGSWDVEPAEEEGITPSLSDRKIVETKKDRNSRRKCKWCTMYKPDRCHHCRVCRECVLRMDHHCPWVYNCIGFRNYKYFFLLLLYGALSFLFVTIMLTPALDEALETDVPLGTLTSILFGVTLSSVMGLLNTIFLGFHLYLIFSGLTTIEFCEKGSARPGEFKNVHDKGWYVNICGYLGSNPLLWLFPGALPEGDGLEW